MSVRRPKFVLGAISILLTGAIASCSAPVDSVLNGLGEGNGDRVSVAGDAQEGIEGDSDKYGPIGSIKVAPGTLPPTGEPQPGHARLNSEGYYDYTAEDFILGDPCPPRIKAALANEGYDVHRPSDFDASNFKDGEICIAQINRRGLGTGVTIESVSVAQASQKSKEVRFNEYNEFWTYTLPIESGNYGVCKAGIDTPEGSRGIFETWGENSTYKNSDAACTTAQERIRKYILEDN